MKITNENNYDHYLLKISDDKFEYDCRIQIFKGEKNKTIVFTKGCLREAESIVSSINEKLYGIYFKDVNIIINLDKLVVDINTTFSSVSNFSLLDKIDLEVNYDDL